MANYTTILVEETEVETGRILTITLNRPQRRNALTSAMIHELTLALRAAEDSRCRHRRAARRGRALLLRPRPLRAARHGRPLPASSISSTP